MNTPITDAASLHNDAFDSPAKAREFARRLELDRQIYRQALIEIYLSPSADSRALANAALQAASKFEGEEHLP